MCLPHFSWICFLPLELHSLWSMHWCEGSSNLYPGSQSHLKLPMVLIHFPCWHIPRNIIEIEYIISDAKKEIVVHKKSFSSFTWALKLYLALIDIHRFLRFGLSLDSPWRLVGHFHTSFYIRSHRVLGKSHNSDPTLFPWNNNKRFLFEGFLN